MAREIHGFKDIVTILDNIKQLGGAIEADSIHLSSGEVFSSAAIECIDYSGLEFYFIGIMTDRGEKMLLNIREIQKMIHPVHKSIHELQNQCYKKKLIREKARYFKRLVEINAKSHSPLFEEEVRFIVEDIGINNLENELEPAFWEDKKKVIHIA